MPEGARKDPNREDAGVIETSLLNASGGSMIDEGRNDGLGTLGVLAGVWAGVLAGVVKAAMSVSNVGIEGDDEELGVGAEDGVLADGNEG